MGSPTRPEPGPGGSFWNQSAYCCAKANRGYLTDVNDPGNDKTQNANYYKTMPFSTYSAYSQTICPFIYSFAYDDYNDQSGIQGCQNATEMDVTWCPGDPSSTVSLTVSPIVSRACT